MKRLFLLLFFVLQSLLSPASAIRHTLSGYVRDSVSGEYLIGATVYIKELQKGTTTNSYGFYSVSVDEGNYTLLLTYSGYTTRTISIILDRSMQLDIRLQPLLIEGNE